MLNIELGSLEQVDIKEVWTNEPGEFTPWLAKEANLRRLGQAIGMELELEAQEKSVGPFRADILCRDTGSATGDWVLIENQIERTDHTHLGQILTYAAGLQAVTIIWIAKFFTDEHRAALDWLNEITDERIRFFGIEIELWRIGKSALAPKFNLISKPNDWTKSGGKVTRTDGLTATQQRQLEFWTDFAVFLREKQYMISNIPKPAPQCWANFSVERGGFIITPVASTFNSAKNCNGGELRMELVINDKNAKQLFKALMQHQVAIEEQLGEKLTWQDRGETVKQCKVFVLKEVVNVFDPNRRRDYCEWLYEKLIAFQRIFRPIVSELAVNQTKN